MYDYRKEMFNDIKESLTGRNPEYDKNADYDDLYEAMWIDDSITGNGSGSYFFNSYKAKQAINDNFSLVCEAYEDFGCLTDLGNDVLNEDFEKIDVTIRCYLLGQILQEVLSELGC